MSKKLEKAETIMEDNENGWALTSASDNIALLGTSVDDVQAAAIDDKERYGESN